MKSGLFISLFAISLLSILNGCDLGGQDSNEIAASKGIISDQRLFFIPYTNGKSGAPNTGFNSKPKEFVIREGKHIYAQELGGVDYVKGESLNRYLDNQFYLTDSILLIKNDSSEKIRFINPEIDDSLNFISQLPIHIWNVNNWRTDKQGDIFYEISESDFEIFGVDL
jgi:hypothetical protein